MATMLTLTVISIWRYIVLEKPMTEVALSKSKISCTLIWLASGITSFPIILTADTQQYECRYFLNNNLVVVKFLAHVLFAIQFAIPSAVMIILYTLILIKLNSRNLPTSTNRNIRSKRNITTLMLTTITFIFITCSLPWAITLLLSAYTGKNSTTLALDHTDPWAQIIAQLGRISFPSCVFYNPIIYCLFNQRIRNLSLPCRNYRGNNVQIFRVAVADGQ
ncbi:Neuropeptide Y receptor [Trichoplax sp. H2]|nr:Neuropeptide Y receptor [Trichoplax sp. H2]|eukprot:RDD46332.1 Neuropeptide Y receptor [Trichoplax sp. H2]